MQGMKCTPDRQTSRRRKATVYDAVAGRVSYESSISMPGATKHRDTTSNTLGPIPADELLARLSNAPDRHEEKDIYSADRHLDALDELEQLPDSDLLKALHAYCSDFYNQATDDAGRNDWKTLDETALLALGVLIEEAARQLWDDSSDSEMDEESESDEAVGTEEEALSGTAADVKLEADMKCGPEIKHEPAIKREPELTDKDV